MVDRSQELFTTVEIIRKANPELRASTPSRPVDSGLQDACKQVANELRSTLRLVLQIKKLSARKGLFNDPTTQINELTGVVKARLRLQTESLGNVVKATRSAGYSGQCRDHWVKVAEVLQSHLLFNTKTFQTALRETAKNVKSRAQRQKKYTKSNWAPLVQLDSPLFHSGAPSDPARAGAGTAAGASAPGQSADAPGSSGSSSGPSTAKSGGIASGGVALGPPPAVPSSGPPSSNGGPSSWSQPSAFPSGGLRRRQGPGGGGAGQAAEGKAANAGTAYRPKFATGGYAARQVAELKQGQNRNSEARQVEAAIVEMGQVVHQLSGLVVQQEETLDRIDNDITGAADHIKAGELELFKYFRSVTADRAFIFKIFGVLIGLIILFALLRQR